MFERNPVDNRKETLLAVEVTLADGSALAGRVVLPGGKGVHKLLDGSDGSLYVETFDGDGIFVPRKDVRGMKVLDVPKSSATKLKVPDAHDFDPFRVLGLDKGASFEEIRAAYVAKSKLYHPDRYASMELPGEIKAYLEASAKALNKAFGALRYKEHRSEPVYARGG